MSDRDRSRERDRGRSRSRSRSPRRERRRDSRSASPKRERDNQGQSLYVRNVSARTRPDDIKEIFAKYGDVKDVYIPRDFYTKEPKEFAYVQFPDKRDADRAMEELQGILLHGRKLTIQYAHGDRKTPTDMRRRDDNHRGSGRRRSPYRGRRSRSRSRDRDRRRSRSRSRDRDRRRSPSPRKRSPSPRDKDRRSASPRKADEEPRRASRSRSADRDAEPARVEE